ncbi:SDR family oxidoreductase [Nocardiopsis trehalosi]|uniref:SDR family oxidoreductase n=1 Tax=Nocardiopsis trehalosi TaxID=109329 RepID=UPI000832FBD9|nr:SDR family oxidoreductase [Nocardiopsis trehalosi]
MVRVAVVTGAGSGIGREVARGLGADGYAVALAGRRAEALRATADLVAAAGGEPLAVPTDVADPDAVRALFAAVRDRWGRVDVLFNNAGAMPPPTPLDEVGDDAWRAVVDVNLTGAFWCAREAFAAMRAQDPAGGRIINNGSISAQVPRPLAIGYTATKHAVTGLTKAIALEGRPYGIACGQIDIGNAATEMTSGIAAGALQADGSTRAEPTFDAAHVADAVRYMAGLPLSANVPFLTVTATAMPHLGRG